MQYRGVSVDQDRLVAEVRLWGMAVVLCGLCFGLDRVGMLHWLRGGIEKGIVLMDTKTIAVGRFISQPFSWVHTARESAERIASLEDRLSKAAVDQVKLRQLEDQTTALTAIALRTQSGQRADRLAQLIEYQNRVVVVAGTQDGVVSGQIITDPAGVLIGRVGSIGRYMSQVELLSDPSIRLPVQSTTGSSKGVLTGKGNGQALITGVLQAEPLAVGDMVVTAGTDAGFPPGLVVGQVVEVNGTPEAVTKGGIVTLLARTQGWVALW